MLLAKYIGHKALSASLDKIYAEFALALYKDSNAITSKTQVQFSLHNATYFKYVAAVSGKCQFDFPRPCINKSKMTALSSIEILQNHLWINPWNSALTSLIRSNHDINYFLSNVKALALVCYITNYATKGDYSQYQRMMSTTFIQNAHNKAMLQYDIQDQIDWPRNMEVDKFVLGIFNRFAHDCKISGPLAINTLLVFPEYYTAEKSLKKVNLKNLWSYFPKLFSKMLKMKRL